MTLLIIKIDERYYTTPESSDCFMAPFSNGIFLMNLSNTHSLIYNKYPVFKDHLLVITRSYEHQSIRLTGNDLMATYQTLLSVKGFAFYNSSKVAGASQDHKHLQVLSYKAFDNSFFR
jgi:ATP adenylyltransferase